jgi:hypothetical protein
MQESRYTPSERIAKIDGNKAIRFILLQELEPSISIAFLLVSAKAFRKSKLNTI